MQRIVGFPYCKYEVVPQDVGGFVKYASHLAGAHVFDYVMDQLEPLLANAAAAVVVGRDSRTEIIWNFGAPKSSVPLTKTIKMEELRSVISKNPRKLFKHIVGDRDNVGKSKYESVVIYTLWTEHHARALQIDYNSEKDILDFNYYSTVADDTCTASNFTNFNQFGSVEIVED